MTTLAPTGIAALAAVHGDVHVLPVSFAQRRFWVLDQLDEATAAYTMPVALELTGDLDVSAFARAVAHVVARHEALRTVFVMEGDEPVQVVLPTMDVPVVVEDLRALSPAARERARAAAVDDNLNRGFDLAAGPLLRMRLLRTAEATHVWLAAFHHIVADGVSVGLFFREIEEAYAAFRSGQAPALTPLPLQYADFAVWQRKAMAGKAAARQLEYWKRTLADSPTLELATDRKRPAVMTAAGDKRELEIPADAAEEMRALARREGATPYAAFLTAFVALLHRYTAQDDLVVGSISAGRLRTEVEPLIGLFVNTLAIRADASGSPTFVELLRRVRDRTVEALANQDVPFDQVVEAVGPERDRSRSPIFQVAFQLLDGMARELELPGIVARRISGAKDTSKFDLTLMVRAAPDGGLRAVMEYRTDLFDAATIDRMLGHYANLLVAIGADPSRAVSAVPMLGREERRLVCDQWNATSAPIPAWSTPERIVALAQATPDAVAIEAEGEAITWRELDARSARVAQRLSREGVRSGDRVAVMVERSSLLPIALLGVWRAGAAYVPLDAAYPAARIMQVLEDASVSAIVVDAASRHEAEEALALATANVVEFAASDWAAPLDAAATTEAARPAADDVAYVIFTSGSTGRPKGVAVPHGALTNFLASMAERPGLGSADAVVAVTTIAFDIAGLELWLPLTTGARVVIATREVAADGAALRALVAATASATRRTLLQATPATWRLLLEAHWPGTPNLVMLCGGEGWPEGLAQSLLSRGAELWNVYGPTETTIWSARARVSSATLSLGEPLANTTLLVLEPSREPAPLGVPGELWIGGAGLAHGYLGRPDLTAERFVQVGTFGRLYRTGDRVRRLADGRLEFLGRLDDQVKVRGYRIELGEIEQALASAPGVVQAAATVHRSDSGDARIVGYIVQRGGASQAPVAIAAAREAARRLLPEYMVPSVVVELEALPLTPNGKVNRRALPAPDANLALDTPFVAPRTALEAEIAATWASVLDRAQVGVDDDFFALGGHSLLAMRVVARLGQQYGVRLTIGALFEARTVAALANAIEARLRSVQPNATASEIAPADVDDWSALSPRQEVLWVHAQMQPSSTAYHVPVVREVVGEVDVAALEQALAFVAARHEALRLTFHESGGTARQRPAPVATVPVEILSAPGAVDARSALAQAFAQRPFDLGAGPIFRAALVRAAGRHDLLVLVFHHIAFDGASIALVLADLSVAYEAIRAGREPTLPTLAGSFIASARRAARRASEGADADDVSWWQAHLADAPATIDLPVDAAAIRAARPAERHDVMWGVDLRDAIRAYAAKARVSPFAVHLAAVHALLLRVSGQDDIVTVVPSVGRHGPDTSAVVGYLVNMLPIRSHAEPGLTFDALVQRVHLSLTQALQRDDVPFQHLVRAVSGDGTTAPFSVSVSGGDTSGSETRLGDAVLVPFPAVAVSARFDLDVSVVERPSGLRWVADYRADRFLRDTVARLSQQFRRLLVEGLAHPDLPITRIRLIEEADERRLLEEWGVGLPVGNVAPSVHAVLEMTARQYPDRDALRRRGARLSYAELDERASAVARALRASGHGAGEIIALCIERSFEFVVGYFGILKAGGTVLALDPRQPKERVAWMCADSGVTTVLVAGSADVTAPPELERVVVTLAIESRGNNAAAAGATVSPDSPAYVLYTSGSTGRPKGVLVSHRAVSHYAASQLVLLRATPDDRVLQFAAMTFDVSVSDMLWAFAAGAALVVGEWDEIADPDRLGELIDREGVTCADVPPTMIRLLAESRLAKVHTLLVGSEVVGADIVSRWAPGRRLVNSYGPTEATISATGAELAPSDDPPPIGVPYPGYRIYIVDDAFQLVPIGVPGELCIGGDGVALGYLNNPELTAARFITDPFRGTPHRIYRTGDRARWRPDGQVDFLGRMDQQVKLRGVRVELGEVEGALATLPGVASVAVVVAERDTVNARLIGFYTMQAGASLTPFAALRALADKLPAALLPAALVDLAALPLTTAGKVDRRRLEAEAREAVPSLDRYPPLPPRDAIEAVISAVWVNVLGFPVTNVEVSFFEVGGHSLLATRVTSQLARIFRTPMTLRRFFESPTVAGLARAIVGMETRPGQAATNATMLLGIQQMSPAELMRARATASASPQPTSPT